ncbi:MAG: 50S ribosomal protein L3 [Candidatus Azosocius agrarius]|nr:MAG: 50S ribosomal protein L3 [Gammaproteobacteria bacterium]
MLIGLVGIKRAMTRIFTNDGNTVPVTLLEVNSNRITQIKTIERDGYKAVQVTTGNIKDKKISNAQLGHFNKAGVSCGIGLWEFYFENIDSYKLGSEIPLSIFNVDEFVDITGVSKGKGFCGTIKRHNFSRQRMSHGNSLSHRAPGSIGQCQTPGRVFKGKKMSGHMGNEYVTVQNLKIIKLDFEKNFILVKGAVPGFPGSIVLIKKSYKFNKFKFFKGV